MQFENSGYFDSTYLKNNPPTNIDTVFFEGKISPSMPLIVVDGCVIRNDSTTLGYVMGSFKENSSRIYYNSELRKTMVINGFIEGEACFEFTVKSYAEILFSADSSMVIGRKGIIGTIQKDND